MRYTGIYVLVKQPPSVGFPSPSGGAAPLALSSVAMKEKKLGRLWRPKWSWNFRRVMRIPNMCLVLKLDNGKIVSIADEQTHRIEEPPSTVYRFRCVRSVSIACVKMSVDFSVIFRENLSAYLSYYKLVFEIVLFFLRQKKINAMIIR